MIAPLLMHGVVKLVTFQNDKINIFNNSTSKFLDI